MHAQNSVCIEHVATIVVGRWPHLTSFRTADHDNYMHICNDDLRRTHLLYVLVWVSPYHKPHEVFMGV